MMTWIKNVALPSLCVACFCVCLLYAVISFLIKPDVVEKRETKRAQKAITVIKEGIPSGSREIISKGNGWYSFEWADHHWMAKSIYTYTGNQVIITKID